MYKITVILFMLINAAGCATEYNLATRREESLIYGTDKEIRIGEAVAQKVEAKYEINTDIAINERVSSILRRIVAVCDRKDIVYFIKVIDDEDIVNAVSLPGGYVYIFKGLIDLVDNDDQLAGVIAHEVGHITARHGVKRAQASYGALLLQVLASQSNARVAGGVNLALASIFSAYSQQDEFMADRLGLKYMRKAGYNPEEMITMLKKLKENQEKETLREFSYWRTHPYIARRISAVNREITGKLEFRDYLNLTE